MNPSLERISTEIQELLDSLNQDNYESVVRRLSQYIERGTEESVLLGKACLDHFTYYKEELKNTHLEPAICALFRMLMKKSHFCTVFTRLAGHISVSGEFLENLSSALQLSAREKFDFGFALLYSENNDLSMAGRTLCMLQREESYDTFDTLDTQFETQNVITSSVAMDFATDFTSSSQAVTTARFGSALSIRPVLAAADSRETSIEVPPSEVQDKISYIVNNLSAANVDAKAKEFIDILAEQYYPWFAHYIVMKKVSLEPKLHMMYIDFLTKTSSRQLDKEIVRESYKNCKVHLRSDLKKPSSEVRRLLRNLGGWLGKLTIGRDLPLLARQIDLKTLILEAYEKGLMYGVLSFTSNILKLCQSSKAYQLPNPWTSAILGLLVEVHALPNLRVPLKQEITLLFVNLKVDMKAIRPTSLLKDRVRIIEGNPDFYNKDVKPAAAGPSYQDFVSDPSISGSAGLPSINSLYEAMASSYRFLPSFPSLPAPLVGPSGVVENELGGPEPSLTMRAAMDKFRILLMEIEILFANDVKEAEIKLVIAEVLAIICRCISKDEVALGVAQEVYESLYKNAANSALVNTLLDALAAICDFTKVVGKEQITSWVFLSYLCRKINKDITVGLMRRGLLDLAKYDIHMALLIKEGENGNAREFAASLVQILQTSDARLISELRKIVDALAKVTNAASKSSEIHRQVSMLLAEWHWMRYWNDDASCADYVQQLYRNVLSKEAEKMPDLFFTFLLELAVSNYLSSEGNGINFSLLQQQDPFFVVDLYADLVFYITKVSKKLDILSKVLSLIMSFIEKDATEKLVSFEPRPYFRLYINFFFHLGTLDSVITKSANFEVLKALSICFHYLKPVKFPAFSFVWLELISHKDFMPKLLNEDGQIGWRHFQDLLVDLLQFMRPFLMEPLLRMTMFPTPVREFGQPVRLLYKGTLKVLLVLMHDFPEFLSCYHFNLCEVIPPHCVQMRNIILTACPHNIWVPDPHSCTLKVDLLPAMSQHPIIDSMFDAALEDNNMKSDVDEYLNTRPKDSSFLSQLKNKLLLPSSEIDRSGTCYNRPLMNSLVLYVGTKAIEQLQASTAADASFRAKCVGAPSDIFRTLILDLDSDGRNVFFNAVADQLRYPNIHTNYFSYIMLYFFEEINQEAIQEQITRVIVERLITRLPRPWGVQFTFSELVKNPRYNLLSRNFTKCAPEFESWFNEVGRAYGIPTTEGDSGVSAGVA